MWMAIYRVVLGGIASYFLWPEDEPLPSDVHTHGGGWDYYGRCMVPIMQDPMQASAGDRRESSKDIPEVAEAKTKSKTDAEKQYPGNKKGKGIPIPPGTVLEIELADKRGKEKLTVAHSANVVWGQ